MSPIFVVMLPYNDETCLILVLLFFRTTIFFVYYLDHELILFFLIKMHLLLFHQREKNLIFIKLTDVRNKLILISEEEKRNKALLSRKMNAFRFLVYILVIDEHKDMCLNLFCNDQNKWLVTLRHLVFLTQMIGFFNFYGKDILEG